MLFAKSSIVVLFCLCIYYVYPDRCSGPLRTLTRAVELQSDILNDFLRFLYCKSDQASASWQDYVGLCLQNTTCVGIHLGEPVYVCVLANAARNESMQISNLWLIESELKRFEGLLCYCYVLFEKLLSLILKKHGVFTKICIDSKL